MKRVSVILLGLALLLAFPAHARWDRQRLSPSQSARVRREIRSQAQWHFALFDGRHPALKTVIRPVIGSPNLFTAKAEISAIWRGARTPLADNLFTVTRRPDGKVTVSSQHPFIPR